MLMDFLKFDVTIEILRGSRNKHEVDHETGRIQLDRMLFTLTRCPNDYGFIDDSLGLDDDPLGALVLLEEPTSPSCAITCRTLGMLRMSDEHGRDDKVLCVSTRGRRASWHTELEDASGFHRPKIQHFFEVHKDLEPGKSVEGADWVGRAGAEKETLALLACFREKGGPDAHTYIHRQDSPGRRQGSPGLMRRHS